MTFSMMLPKPEKAKQNLHHPLIYRGKEADLPSGYATDLLVVMMRDPHWLFCYWDFSSQTWLNIESLKNFPFFLRVKTKQKEILKVPVVPEAHSWYLEIPQVKELLSVDFGVATETGFLVLLESNQISIPLGQISSVTDEMWLSIDELYGEERYSYLGASPLYWQKAEERAEYLEYLASPMPISAPYEKQHYLWLDTELIVYGQTTPNSALLLNGHTVPLDDKGNFYIKLKLNEGSQNLYFESFAQNGLVLNKVLDVERRLSP